jgi:pullulanase/glycogen debranching enzyme
VSLGDEMNRQEYEEIVEKIEELRAAGVTEMQSVWLHGYYLGAHYNYLVCAKNERESSYYYDLSSKLDEPLKTALQAGRLAGLLRKPLDEAYENAFS